MQVAQDGECGFMTRTLRILFVEDMADSQRVGVRLFQAHGHQVKLASNGREAVELFMREPFDLVVMDLQMPEMDGWQAAQEIRRRETASRRTPIIAVSAYCHQSDRERFEAAGINAFVAKPIDNSRLMQTIAAVCSDSGNSTSAERNEAMTE
jgi:two-component system, sensor histidine kinase and response regulator